MRQDPRYMRQDHEFQGKMHAYDWFVKESFTTIFMVSIYSPVVLTLKARKPMLLKYTVMQPILQGKIICTMIP